MRGSGLLRVWFCMSVRSRFGSGGSCSCCVAIQVMVVGFVDVDGRVSVMISWCVEVGAFVCLVSCWILLIGRNLSACFPWVIMVIVLDWSELVSSSLGLVFQWVDFIYDPGGLCFHFDRLMFHYIDGKGFEFADELCSLRTRPGWFCHVKSCYAMILGVNYVTVLPCQIFSNLVLWYIGRCSKFSCDCVFFDILVMMLISIGSYGGDAFFDADAVCCCSRIDTGLMCDLGSSMSFDSLAGKFCRSVVVSLQRLVYVRVPCLAECDLVFV